MIGMKGQLSERLAILIMIIVMQSRSVLAEIHIILGLLQNIGSMELNKQITTLTMSVVHVVDVLQKNRLQSHIQIGIECTKM